ncbi:leucine-rich repeat-containing protein 18 isoform X3 [Drosophila subpulchrella]|uniref:leucine-rich repeat-containing protein 18 isoform X3 n=1 Tax=Drosophila subpulchrella TaxID=1486046 RepID=UPI0018A196AB|nr:leucine-rich repeat-containing protein 18 isoform X3 [Drosophila subpulchrella]
MNKTILHWSYLNFKDVPMDLFLYEDLEEVYLKENFISVIPKWLLNITTLKFIHLAGNNLSELPTDIYMLENLEFLDVSNNELKELPPTLGLLLNLQQLNVSGNQLTELPVELSSLRNLEHLNIAKNQFRRLPIQLSECVRLNELNVSDNEALVHIPERISNLPMLQSLAADRCALIYLPAALSKFMNHVRIFHNTAINYIPMVYERFYQNFYDNRQRITPIAVHRKGLFWVRELETNNRLVLPVGTRTVFPVPSTENRVTLYDDCLHALQSLNRSLPVYENAALHRLLPEPYISSHINNGPIARCTNSTCSRCLYTSYYFMVVKRRGSTSKQLFTCNFCTNRCALLWLTSNDKKYYQVNWRVSDDDDDDEEHVSSVLYMSCKCY